LGETSPTYRVVENTLIEFLLRVEYLVDLTNSLKIKVALKNYNISYDSGSHKLSSSNNIVLELLEPFWSSTTATVDSDTLAIDLNNFNIVNNGYLKVYPVITFTTSVAVTLIKLFMESSNEGIIITDSIFGTSTYLTLIIDCLNGTIDMGGLDRSISIYPGTGYFSFPVGNSTLATYTWTGAINNNWSNNGNWNVGGSYPDGADDDAIINSGTPLLDVGVTVGTVTIGSGITLDCASQNFTFTSLFSDGTLKLVGNQATQVITNMDISSGDVTYYGFVAGTIRLIEFYDLIIAGFSTYTLNAAIVVYGDLSISSGTLDVSGSDYQITVTGDWVAGAGSFTEQSGKVTMNGTGTVPFETLMGEYVQQQQL